MQEGCLKKKKNCFNSTSIECWVSAHEYKCELIIIHSGMGFHISAYISISPMKSLVLIQSG
jgi:hypothetical protein